MAIIYTLMADPIINIAITTTATRFWLFTSVLSPPCSIMPLFVYDITIHSLFITFPYYNTYILSQYTHQFLFFPYFLIPAFVFVFFNRIDSLCIFELSVELFPITFFFFYFYYFVGPFDCPFTLVFILLL